MLPEEENTATTRTFTLQRGGNSGHGMQIICIIGQQAEQRWEKSAGEGTVRRRSFVKFSLYPRLALLLLLGRTVTTSLLFSIKLQHPSSSGCAQHDLNIFIVRSTTAAIRSRGCNSE